MVHGGVTRSQTPLSPEPVCVYNHGRADHQTNPEKVFLEEGTEGANSQELPLP